MLTRRDFLKASTAAFLGAAGLGVYAVAVEPQWVEFVSRPLAIRGLSSRLEGATLVHLSDMHVGGVSDEYVIEVFQKVAALRPDIVVATGDLIGFRRSVERSMEKVYRHFPKGRLASIATLGNHDYGPRWSYPEIAAKVTNTLGDLGIQVLRNEICEVASLQIAGLDDLLAGQCRVRPVIAQLNPSRSSLVLSHNPDTVDRPGWDGYDGWVLCGHTHGGQCKLPLLGPPVSPCRNRRYLAGEVELPGRRRMYISRGIGNIFHVRFNVRPEVTVFAMQRA